MQLSRERTASLGMMKFRLPHILLLLLPGKIQAENPESDGKNNGDVTVNILIFLLFVLLLLLFVAWHYLNRVTEGRYHPRHLMRILVVWWQQFWRERLSEDLAEDYQDEQQNDGEPEEEQQEHEEDGEEEEEEEEEETEEEDKQQQFLQEEEEKLTKEANQEAVAEAALEEDEASKTAQGSSEILLSHLHSFSGTASWEDNGKSLSVTAL